ncbi:MAG: hypothetical protein EOS25_24500 [Mesorhizobium sp.]|uniref:DUF6932 family protein n=1 Tax=Mesorhizobium sp. TaxID=1871066 RepID=UPI000FE98675|nr:hypothetical protein [Mesorhizobium sp.]RWD47901.1 MAG: hypothetical protein EOS59_18060 [Mesorhizobium sp.]RWE54216.1 MAG: hypothetical protein EOS24_25560 [Mesorhizobium sp.]RWF07994.1 MAG: hypothetical protein EOS69_25520 [Mesorhizobium sp.]RWF15182.1 MAG: hypothetical protein EOS25_24500 [Mesorhizobium sp.]TIY06272.1 MAG: hypothetical protein E5V22_03985 [Mesorhizobium sp.]
MPIPDLTPFGVLPTGCYDCTLAEIQARYTTNQHRQELWTSFQQFLHWINNQPRPANCLIDGGFTSDKAAPKDIDVVFDLSGCNDGDRNHWFIVFMSQRNQIYIDYRVDFWVYYPGAGNDLRAFFEYVKPEEALVRGMQPQDRKGLLRVVL